MTDDVDYSTGTPYQSVSMINIDFKVLSRKVASIIGEVIVDPGAEICSNKTIKDKKRFQGE